MQLRIEFSTIKGLMATRDEIRSVTYLKTRAADLLRQINGSRRPVVITQKSEAKAVLLDPETYDRMRTAIGLLQIVAQGEEAARKGRAEPQKGLFARLERKLKSGRKRARA